MPRTKYTHEPAPCANLASRISRVLDEGGVPHVLFGWLAVALIGCNEGFGDVDFIIADEKIEAARERLKHFNGATACEKPGCPHFKVDPLDRGFQGPSSPPSRNRYRLPGKYHFHVNPAYVLRIHEKSNIAPWLPDPQPGPPAANDPNYWRTNDWERWANPGDLGPSGPWIFLYPIKTLSPDALMGVVGYRQDMDAGLPIGNLWSWMRHSLSFRSG
ncbi:hypothetical protein BDV18DRAFT_132117 [Aspergillus unguis]